MFIAPYVHHFLRIQLKKSKLDSFRRTYILQICITKYFFLFSFTQEATPATPEPSNEEASTIKDASDDIENRSNGEHSSLEDPTGDPTKPDLLGDISDESESKTNGLAVTEQEVSEPQHVSHNDSDSGLEKGIVDMNISEQAKEEEKIMNA